MLLLPVLCHAQGTSTGLVSLQILNAPQTSATGEAFVAQSGSVASSWLNPANLDGHQGYEVSVQHVSWIQDISMDALHFTCPFIKGTASFAITTSSVDDIEIRDIPGASEGTFNSRSSDFQCTYALPITRDISAGITAKYLYEKIYVDETSGYGLDLGGVYQTPYPGVSVGAAVTNIGHMPGYRSGSIDLPSALRLGATYTTSYDEYTFSPALAFSRELNQSVSHVHIGGEATYNKLFSLRLGYITGIDARGFSAGLGLHYGIVSVDYAYIPFSYDLGETNSFSIGFSL
jgi:hypothetical protein